MNERHNQFADLDGALLSPAGQARREAMLDDLHGALAAKRRRRVATRAAGAAALAIAVAAGAWLAVRPAVAPKGTNGGEIAAAPTNDTMPAVADGSKGAPDAGRVNTPMVLVSDRAPRVEVVGPDSSVLLRMAIAPDRPSRIEVIDDMTLTRTLAARGENVGIARVGGKVMLVANGR